MERILYKRQIIFTCLLVFLLLIFNVQFSKAVSVDGERFIYNKTGITDDRVLLQQDYIESIELSITLPPIPEEYLAKNQAGGPLQVGFGRTIPTPYTEKISDYLVWDSLQSGGQITTFTITSPNALSMRLAIQVFTIPEGTEMRFFSLSDPEQIFGPFTRRDLIKSAKYNRGANVLFWSPVIEGETIGIEIYVPSVQAREKLLFRIPQISHLFYSPLKQKKNKDLSQIGQSGSCNIDVNCKTSDPAKDAVAKIIFTKDGYSYMCTATLLSDNDSDSFIPYFMTAAHCVNSQDVADTINSYWFFERQTCNGPDPTTVIQRINGGELISTGDSTDFTLLQLNDEPPSNVAFAGWDSSQLSQEATVIGIHHPMGDLKKWSQGTHTGFADYGGDVDGEGTHSRIVWSEGTTEGGSSGSPLFDSFYHFRGNLHGGGASCESPDAPDWYGRFDLTFPHIKSWIWDGPMVIQSGDTYSESVDQYESKEYKITINSPMEIKLFNLSQDADLYVRLGNRPTLSKYDCRPYLEYDGEEICTLTDDGVYYIRVRGRDAGLTTFSLSVTPLGSFRDVPPDFWAFDYIETLYASGITSGCGDGNFCPNQAVTRAQMAVFLERGIHGFDYTPPAAVGVFDDVSTSYWAADWIERLYIDEITSGCSSNHYCPNQAVTRAQMAVFLLRAEHGADYIPPSAAGIFDDVSTSYWAADWIEQLYSEGITSGCGDGNFCPNQPVTRAQMAVFLVRTFEL